jgi:hypothetical protein
MPRLGPVKTRWLIHQRRCRLLVFSRIQKNHGLCEAECGRPAEDWAHCFGRRNLIAEPWCSLPELTMGLCRSCHRKIDGDVGGTDLETRKRLQWKAVESFLKSYGKKMRQPVFFPRTAHGAFGRHTLEPVGVLRAALAQLAEEDIRL